MFERANPNPPAKDRTSYKTVGIISHSLAVPPVLPIEDSIVEAWNELLNKAKAKNWGTGRMTLDPISHAIHSNEPGIHIITVSAMVNLEGSEW